MRVCVNAMLTTSAIVSFLSWVALFLSFATKHELIIFYVKCFNLCGSVSVLMKSFSGNCIIVALFLAPSLTHSFAHWSHSIIVPGLRFPVTHIRFRRVEKCFQKNCARETNFNGKIHSLWTWKTNSSLQKINGDEHPKKKTKWISKTNKKQSSMQLVRSLT